MNTLGNTLGERLDRDARAVLARRGEPVRRLARLERPAHRWDPPGTRRLRVEADVPPAWDDEPPTGDPVGPPVPFPTELRERLRPVVGPGLDRVALHDGDTDPAADALARAHDAAAVTVGQQIFLRKGQFRPHSPQGRGLLAHEAVHAVLATRTATGWRRATAAGRAHEERMAHTVGAAVSGTGRRTAPGPTPRTGSSPAGPAHVVAARRLLVRDGGSPAPAGPPPRLPARPGPGAGRAGVADVRCPAPTGSAALSAAVATPMAAPMAAPLDAIADPAPAPPATGPDLGSTRDAVLRELMRQVRTDRERGA